MNVITGILNNWFVQKVTDDIYIIWGDCQEDFRGRFYHNQRMHTSTINFKDHPNPKEGDVVETMNSSYLLKSEMGVAQLGKSYDDKFTDLENKDALDNIKDCFIF